MRPHITLPTASLAADSNYLNANILPPPKLTTTVLTPQSLSLRRCIAFQPFMSVALLALVLPFSISKRLRRCFH
jgi:hypothetical protein